MKGKNANLETRAPLHTHCPVCVCRTEARHRVAQQLHDRGEVTLREEVDVYLKRESKEGKVLVKQSLHMRD